MDYSKLIKFLSELSKNNNKEWFDAHRTEYQTLRSDFENVVRDLILGIGEFDSKIKLTDPKKALFRINRDIRFSKEELARYNRHIIIPEFGLEAQQKLKAAKELAAFSFYQRISGLVIFPSEKPGAVSYSLFNRISCSI